MSVTIDGVTFADTCDIEGMLAAAREAERNRIMKIIRDEYRVWCGDPDRDDEDSHDAVLVSMGAIGSLANVMATVTGFKLVRGTKEGAKS